MVDGDVEYSQAVTHSKIAITNDDGTVVVQQVLESLDIPAQASSANAIGGGIRPVTYDEDMDPIHDMSPPPTSTAKKSRVSLLHNYKEF